MKELSVMARTRGILERYQFRVQKKYGQNFLTDERILTETVEAAELGSGDVVVEIGPGLGTMTQLLAEQAGNVLAVEIDQKLIPILEERFEDNSNVRILQGDILKIDLQKILQDAYRGKTLKVVANLPYYITTPILMELLEGDIPFQSIVVMVQKEVAQRMVCTPGGKDYGALSLAVQYFTRPEIVLDVPAESFFPRPKVDSAVVRLVRNEVPPVACRDSRKMFALIRAAFAQRRKTLRNAVANAGIAAATKEQIGEMLEEMGLPVDVRGERLSLEEFARLSDRLFRVA